MWMGSDNESAVSPLIPPLTSPSFPANRKVPLRPSGTQLNLTAPWADDISVGAPSSSTSLSRARPGGHARTQSERSPNHPLLAAEGPSPDFKYRLQSASTSKEKDVFVHQVGPRDSLAGIALRYGTDLADLRRVNKLWSSDSIHLRKIIYIPIEGRKHHSVISHTPPPLIALSDVDGAPPIPPTAHDYPHIERVPVTQLSFFPPPRQSFTTRQRVKTRVLRSPGSTTEPSISGLPHPSSIFSSTLLNTIPSSLFLLFPRSSPIDPHRISLDSTSSATPSPRNSIDNEELEMDPIPKRSVSFDDEAIARHRSSSGDDSSTAAPGPVTMIRMLPEPIRTQPEPIRGMQVPPVTHRLSCQ